MEYCFFKEGITPSWEDEANLGGGAIFVDLPRLYRHLHLNKLMLEVLYTLLGHQLPPALESTITGVAVNNTRVCVWVNSCDKERIRSVGTHLEGKLGANHLARFKFIPHVPSHSIGQQQHGANSTNDDGSKGDVEGSQEEVASESQSTTA